MQAPSQTLARFAVATALILSLGACGGGGGGGIGFPLVPPSPGGGDTGGGGTGGGGEAPAADTGVAASCANLTSGDYRFVSALDAYKGESDDVTGVVKIRAGLLASDGTTRITQLEDENGESGPMLPVEGKACEFTLDDSHFAFGPNGVGLVTTALGAGNHAITVVFPEQRGTAAISAEDMVGTFNYLDWGYDDAESHYKLQNYGHWNIGREASRRSTCPTTSSIAGGCTMESLGSGAAFVPAEAGAGGVLVGTGYFEGFFANGFKFENVVTLIAYSPLYDGVVFFTKQQPGALPAAGSVSSNWAYTVDAYGMGSPLGESMATVAAVDESTGVVTRRTPDNVEQTVRYNAPLNGFRKRDGGNCVSPAIQLGLGSGLFLSTRLGASSNPSNGFLALTATKPAN